MQAPEMPVLLPRPKTLSARRGAWTVPERPTLSWDGPEGPAPAALRRTARLLAERTGRPWRVSPRGESETAVTVTVRARAATSGPAAEAHRLTVGPRGVRIELLGAKALEPALATLRQLLAACPDRVPGLVLEDQPDFTRRGYMLDISRCKVPRQETLYRLVDLMADCKLNELQLYTEHTFAFPEHDVVWGDASPVTAEQVRALDEYAHERGVELVPNFNSFGHWERWLRHPEYHVFAESPEGFDYRWGGRSPWGSTLRPDATSLVLLDSLYEQLLPNFRSDRFNIGCDETWELGQGWSQPLCQERGKHRVYFEFLREILQLARRHGRRAQFWADIILEEPHLVAELPEGSTGLVWGYEADHPFETQCRHFASAGLPYYVCPGTSAWNSLGGRLDNALGNLALAASAGHAHGAEGYLITDWGDGGHHQMWPVSLPGILAGAARAWHAAADPAPDLATALDRLVFRDPSGASADLLLGLGRLRSRIAAATPNRHPLNGILFAPAAEVRQACRDLTREETESLLAELQRLDPAHRAPRPGASDGELLAGELAWTWQAMIHAARRAGHSFGALSYPPAEFRRALIPLIGRYEELWLARNRPGGLHESSTRLRATLT